jgi:hypothetical protein
MFDASIGLPSSCIMISAKLCVFRGRHDGQDPVMRKHRPCTIRSIQISRTCFIHRNRLFHLRWIPQTVFKPIMGAL